MGRRDITPDEVPHLEALGRRLAELRAERGFYQRTVASLAGVTAGHVSVLERGKRRTCRETLENLARALAVDPADAQALAVELVELAGPALGLSELERQERKAARFAVRDTRATVKSLREMRRTYRQLPPSAERARMLTAIDERIAQAEDQLATLLAEREANRPQTEGAS